LENLSHSTLGAQHWRERDATLAQGLAQFQQKSFGDLVAKNSGLTGYGAA
jgi:hypothetical protein